MGLFPLSIFFKFKTKIYIERKFKIYKKLAKKQKTRKAENSKSATLGVLKKSKIPRIFTIKKLTNKK
jgi:hypothetical protein